MDATEQIAAKHLATRSFASIVYEPDGNVPPDFLLDGRIAVEVRRLNQHEDTAGRKRGLEETEIPLLKRFRELLASFGPPNKGRSWFVMMRYQRPIEEWKTLRPKIHKFLETFRDGSQTERADANFGSRFSISLAAASQPHLTLYVTAGYSDWDSGGFLLEELQNNIQHCSDEKQQKIKRVREKYPEWWLLLIDHIGYGLSDFDREQFKKHVSITHDWDRVILVNPLDPTWYFEI